MRAALITISLLFATASAGLPFTHDVQGKKAAAAKAATKVTARQVAHSLESHYRRIKTMEAVFLEKYTSGGAGIRVESGKVYFSRPGRMRWDYDSPEKKMFLVDGKNVWYYAPADHTASRTSIKKSSDWRTPLALLAGKVNLERLCGSLELSGGANPPANTSPKPMAQSIDPEERATEAGNAVLVCTPRKEDRDAFSEVLFEVNPRHQLARVTIRQAADVETEFRFANWRENVPLDEAKFHFEPPAGVAIVDDASLAKKVQ